MNFRISTTIFTAFSPSPAAAYYEDEKGEWWEQSWSIMIGTYDYTTIIGPNILCLDLNVVYSETKYQFLLTLAEIHFPYLTYLNRAISKLINKILTISIWKANMTLVATNAEASCLALDRNEEK